jgi:NAD(P)-dependent dehydrogenase (short-subunit alcohol dehydrogenase family)
MAWTAASLPDLAGRTALVTGANSGIGLQTAKEFAAHGARVVLACRDMERGKLALRRIRSLAGPADLDLVELDLSRIASVRELGEQWSEPLDMLINNAGVMAPPRPATTADGFELQFGTNHIGHYILTGLLLPSLLRTAAPRVVTVASIAHFGGQADVVDANAGEPYRPQKAYSNSKLANLLFADELQRRASANRTALVSTAAHPGVSATGLVQDRQGMGANPLYRLAGPVVLKLFTQSAVAGARASLFAATEAQGGSYTGPQRFGESRGAIGPAKRSACAQDAELARQLWTVTEDLTGLRYPWPSGPQP